MFRILCSIYHPLKKEVLRRENLLRYTVELAQTCEKWGYKRYWMAEHHNMSRGRLSSATSLLIGQMLLTHDSGPLCWLRWHYATKSCTTGYCRTIWYSSDHYSQEEWTSGLGRAPGTDELTAYALRDANRRSDGQDFQNN